MRNALKISIMNKQIFSAMHSKSALSEQLNYASVNVNEVSL